MNLVRRATYLILHKKKDKVKRDGYVFLPINLR